jgi:hypothetical protein
MSEIFIIFILSLSFLVGNLFKPSIINPDIRFTLLDISVLAIWILGVIFYSSRFIANFRSHPQLWKPIAGFSLIGVFSLLFSGYRFGPSALISGFLYLLRWVSYAALVFPLTAILSSRSLFRIRFILSFILIFTGTVQYLIYPDIRPLTEYNWDPHYFRVVGTLLINISRSIFWVPVYLVFAFTYSRSGYLAFLTGSFYVAGKARSILYIGACFLLIGVTLVSLPRNSDGEGVKLERTNSIFSRLENWNQSLSIFFHKPVLGVGFNTYRYAKRYYGYSPTSKWLTSHADAGADSSLLFVAATTGMVGLLVYLSYLRAVFLYLGPSLNNRVIFTGLIFHSFFLNSLFYPYILFWLGLLMAESMDYRKQSSLSE